MFTDCNLSYATNDDAEIRAPLADYFNCGDAAERADFWGCKYLLFPMASPGLLTIPPRQYLLLVW